MEIRLIAGDLTLAHRHVIFVHGLTGHIKKTWTSNTATGKVHWPIWLNEDIPEIAIWLVGYPAPLTNWFLYAPKLSEIADNMLARLRIHSQLAHGELFFVTHSLGGLVVKQMLLSAHRDISLDPKARNLLNRVKGVAYLGTPHKGSFLANLAMLFRLPLRASSAVQPLVVGNDQVQTIFSSYKQLSKQYRLCHLPLCEGRPLRFLGISWPFKIVSSWSADPGVEENLIPMISDDHMSISKPRDRDSDVYQQLLEFLKKDSPRPLPSGIERPEWLMGERGLRARLRRDVQAYVPAGSGPTVKALLYEMKDYRRPLVITGDGGLGKTRLALELYLESGYEGYLIQNKATVETIETLIQKAKDENRKIVFLIDYIEELSGIFDSIHQSITRNSDGFAYLITTTRTLSSMHSALPGPRNLNATACKEVALNDRLLETWRREVCAEILRKAGLPQHVCEGFSNLDIPVIASLLAYDYVHLGTVDDENIRSDDGGWLNRRLLRHVSEKLSEADVVFLLTLYPFDDGFRQLLSKSMQETSDELYRNGWVSTVSSADGTKEWRLGHDLLADISLVSLLLKETKSILRFEMINDLSERAKALKASQRFGRSLARALNRLVASTWADEVMDTLMACVEPLAVSNENQNHALITCKQSLLSLSISLGDKIRILRELSGLSLWQLQELSKVFTDELNQFVRFRAEHAEVIKQLLLREACGSKVCLAEMQKEYQITIPPIAIASAVPPRLPGVFIPSFHELATSTGITLPTVVDSTSLQAVTHPEDVDFFDYFNQNMPILSQQSLYSDVAQEVAEKALLSLSLDPRNKLRVLTQLPQLSEWQLKKLIATFDKEVEVIRKLLATEESSIQELIRKAALGNANYLTLIADRYQTHVQFESLPDAVPQQNGGFLATMPGAQEIAKLDQNSRIWIARQMLFAVTKSTGNASRNLSNYDVIIECFADDRQPQVREVVAQATFQQAQAIAARDKNPQAYNLVIERFANDQHNPVREYAAIAASNLAQAIATRDKNPQAYDWMIERFSDDQYGPIREVAANAAHAKVLRIAERDKSPQVYDWMIERFSNDQYLPIKKLLILARADQIGWFVVFNRFDDAISNGERFLSDANAPDTQKTVVAFLIWMAKPNIEYRQRCELLLSTMQGADFNWTFDEFTEKIETLNDDDQVFARRMVSHLESKAPTQ